MRNNENQTNNLSDYLERLANGDPSNMVDNIARTMIIAIIFLPSFVISNAVYNDPSTSPEIANLAFQARNVSLLIGLGESSRQLFVQTSKFIRMLR